MAPSLATQILSPIALLLGTFLCGISPILVQKVLLNCGCKTPTCQPNCRARKGKVITSFLIYLGGGVLLATCLVHLLPEAREGFEKYEESLHEESHQEENLLDSSNGTLNETDSDGHEHGESFSMPEFVVCCGFFAVYLVEEIIHYFLGGHHHIPTETRAIRSFSRSNSCTSSGHHEREKYVCHEFQSDVPAATTHVNCFAKAGFSATSLLTVAALSFHSLFEGFAIGLQGTDQKLWILFAAVAVHKFVISFVVGLEVLASGGKNVLVFVYMAIFALMSPLGMTISMITQSEVEDANPLTVGVLNAIATGTLLYVTFCEILQREEDSQNLPGWKQFLATFIGFGIMCLVQFASTKA